ncbi:DNA/RNA non-specific endonuclease [Microbacterium enclense]|uniref:DNA/RNA non-specific endonuclease n=1 Tax=Microbacterium enclense TaxID=993073 RepID=UPI003F7E90C9
MSRTALKVILSASLTLAVLVVALTSQIVFPRPGASSETQTAAPSISTTQVIGTAVIPPTYPATGDYYQVRGAAVVDYAPVRTGDVEYCPLDSLGRAVCAYGKLTTALRTSAEARGRQTIAVDPAGWGHNAETTIPANPDVAGSKSYKGYFWNRSHLVADSLGGDPTAQNLVTGTRTQNVGSTQTNGDFAGGMAYTESIARQYLDAGNGDGCPLYYAAKPQYTGAELIPRTVSVDIRSCDKQIDMHVVVENTARSFTIDYGTGGFTAN